MNLPALSHRCLSATALNNHPNGRPPQGIECCRADRHDLLGLVPTAGGARGQPSLPLLPSPFHHWRLALIYQKNHLCSPALKILSHPTPRKMTLPWYAPTPRFAKASKPGKIDIYFSTRCSPSHLFPSKTNLGLAIPVCTTPTPVSAPGDVFERESGSASRSQWQTPNHNLDVPPKPTLSVLTPPLATPAPQEQPRAFCPLGACRHRRFSWRHAHEIVAITPSSPPRLRLRSFSFPSASVGAASAAFASVSGASPAARGRVFGNITWPLRVWSGVTWAAGRKQRRRSFSRLTRALCVGAHRLFPRASPMGLCEGMLSVLVFKAVWPSGFTL